MSFKMFNFNSNIVKGIAACGYTEPTPIQAQAIAPVLEGRDVLGLAQTGTGKTAAFVLPMLERLAGKPQRNPRGLIMAPTRELAEQIYENILSLGAHTGLKSMAIYGGVGKAPQVKTLQQGVDLIVACPGRLLDLLNDRAVNLSGIETLVLDEADQMLDMGFFPDIKRIIAKLPQSRQSLVFSATMPKEIDTLTRKILDNPARVRVNHVAPLAAISHTRFNLGKQDRTATLKQLLGEQSMTTTLVFTRTKYKAKGLAAQLKKAGFKATSLQGNLSQAQRKKAMDGFRSGAFTILVATDIAARGIDVSGISHVINYDLPDTLETYTHRTGRTGRADCTGQAYTFVCPGDEKMAARIEKQLGQPMTAKRGVAVPQAAPVSNPGPNPRTATRRSRPQRSASNNRSFNWSQSMAAS